ncbi:MULTISPECIES: hypothetical protein [Kitasatospora]|uniref:Integral membrane protein n=1 Tax=Kitasatospora cystarginea TaxID=58350 RepID=A0ABN3DBX8_9ACTN
MSDPTAVTTTSTATPATTPVAGTRPLPARLPLRALYPAKYRAAHGDEITAVFAEVVQDAELGTGLREWAALAAHALRLRTRLSSADPVGRIAAGAAPFVLAGGAGLSAVHLLLGFIHPDFPYGWGNPVRAAAGLLQTGPWLLALLCAGLGRWSAARALVVVGTLGRLAIVLAFHHVHSGPAWAQYHGLLGFWTTLGALLLVAPPDGVDLSRRGRSGVALAAIAVAVPLCTLLVLWQVPRPSRPDAFFDLAFSPTLERLTDDSSHWPAAVLSLALLLHLGARRPDRLRAAGIALAALPWTVLVSPPFSEQPAFDSRELLHNTVVVLGLLGGATLLAAVSRTYWRTRPVEPAGLV